MKIVGPSHWKTNIVVLLVNFTAGDKIQRFDCRTAERNPFKIPQIYPEGTSAVVDIYCFITFQN